MKVLLPDGKQLELPDGATGLDAARAIGPKLAEQAVLVRSNGHVRDLRLPLEDGQPIQILTTRDKDDPDALAVLRHSTAHLLAEAVRRLYPGVKIAIGPPIESGFYYDFEFPEPIGEDALEKIETEMQRELDEGREWTRQEISADDARRRFEEEGEPYKVELVDTAEGAISLYTQGEFTDLCRGPHLQNSKPIKAIKLTNLAGAYWRGDEHQLALKPMNCPGHMLLFGSQLRSYRDLPFRYAEASTLHRDELGGTLHGLLRVKHITQDDAHIFCSQDQIEEEIFACLDYAQYLYDLFGMEARFELSTRPDPKLGTDEDWDFTEGALKAALEKRGIEYVINEGDGAFYGPKIDLHMTDVLGRSWQMGTIQLDAQMPQNFGLTYMGADNREHTPYVIHRALLGSLERFIGILTEHYAGGFPFWLAPVQVRVLPVGEQHFEAASSLVCRLVEAGYRAEVGEPTETIGKRIRAAELEKVPVTIVYGDRESDESLAVRERGGEQSTAALAELLERLATL